MDRLLKRVPSWITKWAGPILLVIALRAVSRWILAPLLDIVPAYVVFGSIFVLGVAVGWWKWVTDKRSLRALLAVATLWGLLMLALYAATLEARDDSTFI